MPTELLTLRETCPSCQDSYSDSFPRCSVANDGHCTHCCGCGECEHVDGHHHVREAVCGNCYCCSEHCHCQPCPSCHRMHEAEGLCRHCHLCTEQCCNCTFCSCGFRGAASDFCPDCGYCHQCCEGRDCSDDDEDERSDGSPVRFKNRPLRWFAANPGEFTKNPVKRFISCELEVASAREGGAITRVCDAWSCTTQYDGSLPSGGFEISTSPAMGDVFLAQIKDHCRAFRQCRARVTRACGLHVHVDARDFRYWDTRRLILVYAKVEDALFSILPHSRNGNSFCKRCGDSFASLVKSGRPKDVREALLQKLYGSKNNARSYRRSKSHCSRYTALNVHSWLYRGSFEFRLGAGSVDYKNITNWAMLLGNLLEYAAKKSDKDVDSLSGTSLDILKRLAPTKNIREWIKERHDYFRNNAE